jgi:hypothetical protein
VNKVELQLAGLKFCDGLGTSASIIDEMPLMQKPLAKTVVTLPGTTIVEEFCRRSRVTLRSTSSLPPATSKKVELELRTNRIESNYSPIRIRFATCELYNN